ncbi:MAG TPA: FixH family protein [Blastocatellia bacterium]|nr:FixH family protein [Blastocatellia bacterium]
MPPDNTAQRKSLWGYGIAAVYSIFALATLGVVAFSLTQKVELVSKDYYEKEVTCEQQIERLRQTNAMGQQVTCQLTTDGRFIEARFPAALTDVRGTLTLYRPSDSSLDREVTLAPDAGGRQLIPADKLAKGYWRAKLHWQSGGRGYYNEYSLTVR